MQKASTDMTSRSKVLRSVLRSRPRTLNDGASTVFVSFERALGSNP